MAFNPANLTLISRTTIAGVGQIHLWAYSTADNLSVVNSGSYLPNPPTASPLRNGDILGITAGNGNALGMVHESGIIELGNGIDNFWAI